MKKKLTKKEKFFGSIKRVHNPGNPNDVESDNNILPCNLIGEKKTTINPRHEIEEAAAIEFAKQTDNEIKKLFKNKKQRKPSDRASKQNRKKST